MRRVFLCLLLSLVPPACVSPPAGVPTPTPTPVDFSAQADKMVRTQIEARGVRNPAVLRHARRAAPSIRSR